MIVVAPYSDLSKIDLSTESRTPPEVVFGPEPPHDWCYHYEKADLARQRGDWDEVVSLGNNALDQGFVPSDAIEWMPFLQADAQAADTERLTQIHRQIKNADPYIAGQVCQIVAGMPGLSLEVAEILQARYCLG